MKKKPLSTRVAELLLSRSGKETSACSFSCKRLWELISFLNRTALLLPQQFDTVQRGRRVGVGRKIARHFHAGSFSTDQSHQPALLSIPTKGHRRLAFWHLPPQPKAASAGEEKRGYYFFFVQIVRLQKIGMATAYHEEVKRETGNWLE